MRSLSRSPRALFAVAALFCGASNVGAQVYYNPATGRGYTLTPFGTFDGARAAAAAMGGHLVSIGDAAEQAFVQNHFASSPFVLPVWIGLSDEIAEGTFLWDDGTPFSYSAWQFGAPGPAGAADDAVVLFAPPFPFGAAAVWDDVPASGFAQGVVELDPPAGDTCATAVPVTADGVYPYDSSTGFAPSAASSPCSGNGGPDAFAFWFAYVAPASGTLAVSNCSGSPFAPGGSATLTFDTYFAAWDGGACPPTVALGCSDDASNYGCVQSELLFPVVAGATYYLQIGAWSQPTPVAGFVAFKLHPGDDCAHATALAPGVNGPFSNAAATDTALNFTCGAAWRDVWFRYDTPVDAYVTIATERPAGTAPGTLVDPNLSVYDGCGGQLLACANGLAYDAVTTTVYASANQPLFVRVAGELGQQGTFYLTVTAEDRVLRMTAPLGAGSLRIENLGGDPFGGYVTVLTLYSGAFPNGYFAGIDPTPTELFLQLASGVAPFVGPLDAAGGSSFGPVVGLPPLTLYGVTVFLAPTGIPAGASRPEAFAIP